MKLYEELKWRGLIKDVAGDDLEDKLNNESLTFYWGTDPTADSLHLGHYSSLITACGVEIANKWLLFSVLTASSISLMVSLTLLAMVAQVLLVNTASYSFKISSFKIKGLAASWINTISDVALATPYFFYFLVFYR